ncbi:MAG TPA: hypothetical protein VGR65_03930 [Casimicrobiaceae bacterium]|jgi:hypothetical protein|nr:hypothetical protein [Casimicrobiaceae bacterium]
MSGKFKQAGEALFAGNADEAAKLLAEATAEIAQTERRAASVRTEDLVRAVTDHVTQELKAMPAREQLFADYPELRPKPNGGRNAFALIADDYATAFMTNGDDVATAIQKAGDAVGEEFGLGKLARGAKSRNRRGQGQQDDEQQIEEDYPGIIAELARTRPGNR